MIHQQRWVWPGLGLEVKAKALSPKAKAVSPKAKAKA